MAGRCITRWFSGWPERSATRGRRSCGSTFAESDKARALTTAGLESRMTSGRRCASGPRGAPGIPLVAGGFSFGSRVGLRVVCDKDCAVERFLAVGTPVEHGEWDFLADCRCRTHFLHSTNDEHGRRPTMEAAFVKAAEPKTLTWIEASNHFFSDALDELEQAAHKALRTA